MQFIVSKSDDLGSWCLLLKAYGSLSDGRYNRLVYVPELSQHLIHWTLMLA